MLIKSNNVTLFIFTVFSIASFLGTHISHAQIAENALKFAQAGPVGTARFQAMGGAGFALGGDVSAAALNPAGLGFFNRSTVVISPAFTYTGTTASYAGENSDIYDTNFGISNFGVVFNNSKEDVIPSDWRGGSFAITYNHINSHTFDYTFGPADNDFSILDEFALQANGIPSSELNNNASNDNFVRYADAAYYNYLINPDASDKNYKVSIPAGTIADQDGKINESWRLSQWNFAYGGNFKDKFYIGATIGFRSFNYKRDNQFNEYYKYSQDYIDFIDSGGYFYPVVDNDLSDNVSIDYVNSNNLNETQKIAGTGINANLGFIYRPLDELTIGLSYQTPTFFSVTEDYQFTLASEVSGIIMSDTSKAFDIKGEDGMVTGRPVTSNYSLSTPSRVGAGLTYFFQKYGFITADVEYINYGKNRFNASDFSASYLNDEVDRYFNSAVNYRVGGEFRFDIFRLRLGYAMFADPTHFPDNNVNGDRQVFSGGLGIHTANFYADLAVTNTQYESDYRPYIYASAFPLSGTGQKNSIINSVVTLGFNF